MGLLSLMSSFHAFINREEGELQDDWEKKKNKHTHIKNHTKKPQNKTKTTPNHQLFKKCYSYLNIFIISCFSKYAISHQ